MLFRSLAALLNFLSLREGDTAEEYFSGYSPRQMQWRDRYAEELSWWVSELEERDD